MQACWRGGLLRCFLDCDGLGGVWGMNGDIKDLEGDFIACLVIKCHPWDYI